jgi:lycopene cyclase domain-containing protein
VAEYTVASIAGVVAVVLFELFWLRTGIFTTARFWIAYAIVVFFQVLVDGWLTKLSAPIVIYAPDEFSRWRFPFDVPVEDYLFGFALIALTIMLWERAGRRSGGGLRRGGRDGGPTTRTGTAPTLPR